MKILCGGKSFFGGKTPAVCGCGRPTNFLKGSRNFGKELWAISFEWAGENAASDFQGEKKVVVLNA